MAYLGRPGATSPLTSADIPDSSITTAKLVDSSVNSAKIGVDVIVAEDIANNAVTVAELADNAVTQAKLADDAVGTAELANNVVINTSGAITTTGAFTSVGIDDNSNALAMTIDANENIGFGTTDIEAWTSGFRVMEISDVASIGKYTGAGDFAIMRNAYHDGAWKYKSTAVANRMVLGVAGVTWEYAASGSADASLTWTESMRIDTSGNVGIGTSSPGTKLEVTGSGDTYIEVNSNNTSSNAGMTLSSAGSNMWYIFNHATDADKLYITDAGVDSGMRMNQDGNAWVAISSDERLKTDWVNFSDALDKINTLTKIGEYRRIDPITREYMNDDENKTLTGLSAQEVVKILPKAAEKTRRSIEAYPEDDTEYYGLNYQDVFVLGIKAIQELSAKVTALESA